MAVKGNLKDISLTNLIQMEAQSGLTGRLSVQHAEDQAQIFFEKGEIVHAELGPDSGKDAFYQILGWEDGEFELVSDLAAPDQTINARWSDLLLGGLHHLDESKVHKTNSVRDDDDISEDLGKLFGFEKTSNSLRQGEIIMEDNMPKKMKDILSDLFEEADGLFAAAVVGMDGLPIAEHSRKSEDVDASSAQMTLLIKMIDTTTLKLGAGKTEDFLLTTDSKYMLMRLLGDSDYYLALGATKNATKVGKLRLYSRIYAERLSAVLPR